MRVLLDLLVWEPLIQRPLSRKRWGRLRLECRLIHSPMLRYRM